MPFPGGTSPGLNMHVTQWEGGGRELLKRWCHFQQTLSGSFFSPRRLTDKRVFIHLSRLEVLLMQTPFPCMCVCVCVCVCACVCMPLDHHRTHWLRLHLSPCQSLWRHDTKTPIGRNEARNQESINPNQRRVPNTADRRRPLFIFP